MTRECKNVQASELVEDKVGKRRQLGRIHFDNTFFSKLRKL